MTPPDPLEIIQRDTIQDNSSKQNAFTEELTIKEIDKYGEHNQILKLRETYASRFWHLSWGSLAFVGLYLIFSTLTKPRILSPATSVLITLISTSIANVIAVLVIFARFIFPDGGPKKDK